jgi:hypothetical protein
MRSSSAPGEDGIDAMIWQSGPEALFDDLYILIVQIWNSEHFPDDWKKSILIPIFKKGDKTLCKNYRGITLIDVAYKIVEAIVLSRIRTPVDQSLRENQSGFRPGRSTIDQIYTLRQVLETRREFRRPTIIAFIDFKAAFDSVDRKRMYQLLADFGLPSKIVRLVEQMYMGSENVVRAASGTSAPFSVLTGVKQGALLSPTLFIIVLDFVLRAAMSGCRGVWIDGSTHLTDLDYADDAALMAESVEDMQDMIDSLEDAAAAVGLVLSAEKTKTMRSPELPEDPVMLQGQPLEDVNSFVYLGSTITINGDASGDVMARLAKAGSAFEQLSASLWSLPGVQTNTKIAVYQSAIRPVLLYACESWPLSASDERRLQSFEFRCWRRIIGISYLDHVSNEEVIRRANFPSLCVDELRKRRLSYLGHVLRRDPSSLARAALLADPAVSWSRPPGGPRTTWRKTVLADLKPLNLNRIYRSWSRDWRSILTDLCCDRHQWTIMVKDAVEHR